MCLLIFYLGIISFPMTNIALTHYGRYVILILVFGERVLTKGAYKLLVRGTLASYNWLVAFDSQKFFLTIIFAL